MILPLLAIVFGILVLVVSADYFVESASAIARFMSLSSTFVGLTIVSFGTSAPEILVSLNSVISDSPNLAVGNAIGSNIANIGLVLGLTVVIFPLTINRRLIKNESIVLLLVTGLVTLLCLDEILSPIDGAVMMAALIATLWIATVNSKEFEPTNQQSNTQIDTADDRKRKHKLLRSWTLFVVSLFCLVSSAKLLVWGSISTALFFGVSEHLIGLTIIALGTSLPELAATMASARRGEAGIAIGNIIGSNLFNILAVLCIPAIAGPQMLAAEVLDRDLPVMVGLTIIVCFALLAMSSTHQRPSVKQTQTITQIGRPLGLLFLCIFSIHYVWLYQSV